jgi:restriction endonuclease
VDGLEDTPYNRYLKRIDAANTHNGYFSVDRRGRLVNPAVKIRGESAGEADDADAYDLILRDKTRLLSLDEPVRFIFSHSALREGWDNPNVFVICALKRSDNTVSRRQEVGRGLRLAVTQDGDRLDDPAIVHQINVLTVVANESYRDFVTGLQQDIRASISTPRDSVFSNPQLPEIEDGRRVQPSPLNAHVGAPESAQLWSWIQRNESDRVDFKAGPLISQCVEALNGLKVTPLQYTVTDGEQKAVTTVRALDSHYAVSAVKYDLIGRIAALTHLTRTTIAAILRGVQPETFSQYKVNPEEFIVKTGAVINEQKATVMVARA